MSAESQQPVKLRVGAIASGHLTTAAFSSVLNQYLTAVPQIRLADRAVVDLAGVEWIDHLPLLGVSLIVKECARLCPERCEAVMPAILEREAFLERWGFFRLLDELEFDYEVPEKLEPYKESQHSRVLPITSFSDMQGAGATRDLLFTAEGNLQEVLRKQACLDESDVAALADLVIFELCKNVIEHSRGGRTGFAIAHASTPSAEMAPVQTSGF